MLASHSGILVLRHRSQGIQASAATLSESGHDRFQVGAAFDQPKALLGDGGGHSNQRGGDQAGEAE